MGRVKKMVPVTLTYRHLFASVMCACGRIFEARGEVAELAMNRAVAKHTAQCPASKAYADAIGPCERGAAFRPARAEFMTHLIGLSPSAPRKIR